jgi:hypothetical protein
MTVKSSADPGSETLRNVLSGDPVERSSRRLAEGNDFLKLERRHE